MPCKKVLVRFIVYVRRTFLQSGIATCAVILRRLDYLDEDYILSHLISVIIVLLVTCTFVQTFCYPISTYGPVTYDKVRYVYIYIFMSMQLKTTKDLVKSDIWSMQKI